MKKLFFTIVGSGILLFCPEKGESALTSSPMPLKRTEQELRTANEKEEGIVLFTPPSGWHLADSNLLPKHVRVMVVGNGPSGFPPSLNLSWEPYKGTLRQYLKTVKNMNSAQGYEWKDLGLIRTEAGDASLSQVDTKTQWGDVRLMHVILIKNGNVYILTASALKNDFSIFYKDFFAAMRSLRIAYDLYDVVTNPQQRSQLKASVNKLQSQWQTLLTTKQKEYPEMALIELQESTFKSADFQNSTWKPFLEMLNQKYSHLGVEWLSLFQQKLEDQLFNIKPNSQ